MLNRFILIAFLIFSNIAFGQVDSTWFSKRNKIVIPFELSNNLIILKVNLNGVDLNMILDTGSDINLLFSVPENTELPVKEGRNTSILGIGSKEPIDAIISSNNEININEYVDYSFEILIVNQENISLINKFGIEINGIIGYSFFKNRIIEINYAHEKIIIYKNGNSLKKNRFKRFSKEKIKLINRKPYLKINSKIDSKENSLTLLVDTGLSDGLWLFKNDSVNYNYNKNSIDDILGQGLSGEILGKRARVDKVNFSEFSFLDVLVSFPDIVFFENIKIIEGRNGSLGGELLKRFNLLIDYVNGEISFKKNKFYTNPFNYNMSGIEIRHSGKEVVEEKIDLNKYRSTAAVDKKEFSDTNTTSYQFKYVLSPTFDITHIRKDSPAFFVDLSIGDRIVSINNKKAHYLTIQKITDIFQSEDGKKIKMEVEREGKIIEVVFYLKKII